MLCFLLGSIFDSQAWILLLHYIPLIDVEPNDFFFYIYKLDLSLTKQFELNYICVPSKLFKLAT